MLGLLELLKRRGFDADPRATKLVRHQTDDFDIGQLLRDGWLETYQAIQTKAVFDRCSRIVSFTGDRGRRARFWGVFKVGERRSIAAAIDRVPAGCPHRARWTAPPYRYHYSLSHDSGYGDLEGRLIIDWGEAALAWHQWLQANTSTEVNDKQVLEMLPAGRRLDSFKNYLEFTLSHSELAHLVDHETAHRDWQAPLAAVGGVYLIVAAHSGQQYVGSATGAGGIWRRWCDYARTGHGGNAELIRLVAEGDGRYPRDFTYSLLQTFSSATTREEALSVEATFKRKLGRTALTLNRN